MDSNSFNILIVDDEKAYTNVLEKIISLDGYSIQTASSGEEALLKLKYRPFHLVLSDLMMDGINGIELLEEIKRQEDETEVILITGFGTVKNAVEAMKKGAFSYFVKGNDPEELLFDIKKVYELYELKKENAILKLSNSVSDISLSTHNEAFQKTIDMAYKAAKSNVNILLLGESGVGKDVFARFIHTASMRNDKPYIAVNCHALQESVLESELFGHNKGAFTGANEDRIGRFEAAHEGTLFLDEIADTPLSTQVKLLRSLENKQIERLGSNQIIDVDFRLITATNKDINKLIEEDLFREDFYYRISTIVLEIPPLRKRREDILDLVHFFIEKCSKEMQKEITEIEPEVQDYLLNYDYPGNIRELKNIIERLVVLSEDGIIKLEDLSTKPNTASHENKTLKELRNTAEKEYIKKILEENDYNMTESADILGISRRQLFNKVTQFNLRSEK